MITLKKLVLASCLALTWQSEAVELDVSGFATLSGGITTDKDESLYGFDDKINFSNGSLVALQVSSNLADKWDITTQIIARGDEEWKPSIEWAFISYEATDNLKLLFGRQRAPFYIYSDYLDVSYAYHWIAPPPGVYSLALDTFDGLGAIYTSSFGEFDSIVQLSYGRSAGIENILGGKRETDFTDFYSASWTVTRDWLTLRVSTAGAGLSIETANFDGLINGWQATGSFSGVGDDLQIAEDTSSFVGMGLVVDYNDYLVVGEFTNLNAGDNLIPEQDSYYLTVGKRFDSVLLHLTYGGDENVSDFSIIDGVPRGSTSELDALIAGTNGLLTFVQEDSKYVTLGLRWDIAGSVAAKFEYTDFQDDDILGTDSSLFQFALTTVF